MAFDGVFAFQGKDHITASQLGRIVEGVAGKGRYVLPTLNQMTAEMQTANKVRVGTGDLVMDGRVVTNEAAVDLTVESGTSGYKRNDLVVCRYTKNASTGVEKFAAEVVKGTPTTGTAADPKVTEGDISRGSASAVMPLWRIPINGITPGAPVRIAPVASTLKTLGDSVSPKPITFTSTGVLDIVAYRSGPIVMVEGSGLMSCSEWAEVVLGTGLPENVMTTAGAPVACQSDLVKGAHVHVDKHGELVLLAKATAITGWTFFSFCYLTND